MTNEEIKNSIETDPDFVYYPTLNNSLKRVLDTHPEGLDDATIAKALMISEDEVVEIFTKAIRKIKEQLGDA